VTLFDDPAHAASTARALGTVPLSETGWHNYKHMKHIASHSTPRADWSERAHFAQPGDLPRTDDLLARAVSVSIGVRDRGLGSGFGVGLRSSLDEIERVARDFTKAAQSSGA
jgi:hypothetical protein